jgi:DNA-binding NtrC family response regulator
MSLGDTIDVQDLPPYLQASGATHGSSHDSTQEPVTALDAESGMGTLEDQERQLIVRAMQSAGGNQSQAARILRIGRDALRYKLKKHNL